MKDWCGMLDIIDLKIKLDNTGICKEITISNFRLPCALCRWTLKSSGMQELIIFRVLQRLTQKPGKLFKSVYGYS